MSDSPKKLKVFKKLSFRTFGDTCWNLGFIFVIRGFFKNFSWVIVPLRAFLEAGNYFFDLKVSSQESTESVDIFCTSIFYFFSKTLHFKHIWSFVKTNLKNAIFKQKSLKFISAGFFHMILALKQWEQKIARNFFWSIFSKIPPGGHK